MHIISYNCPYKLPEKPYNARCSLHIGKKHLWSKYRKCLAEFIAYADKITDYIEP